MKEWYDQIDTRIRELVFKLRNSGINTTCSNGEKGYIEAEWHSDVDAKIAYDACREVGYKQIRIECIWATFPVLQKYMKIRLYDKRFGNVPETYVPKIYTEASPIFGLEELASVSGGLFLKHSKIISLLKVIIPEAIFISGYDPKIGDERLPHVPGKEMIYVLNYNLEKDKEFEKATEEYKEIEFYKLTKEVTMKQVELFKRIGIDLGEIR